MVDNSRPEVLPHEPRQLQAKIEAGVKENAQATEDIANAVDNGNVWHDNAEYDEVIERMKNIDARYAPVAIMLRKCVVVDYPERGVPAAQIGSLVDLTQGKTRFPIVIVGQTLAGSEEYEEVWQSTHPDDEELFVVSLDAPLAQAVVGMNPGQETTYQRDGREFEILVHNIDQDWVRDTFGG